MKPFLYELICIDDGGWRDNADLWSPDYDCRAKRIFTTRSEAVAVRRDLESFDYAATTDNPNQDCQPEFSILKISTVELLVDAALVACDDDLFDSVLNASGAPLPAGYDPQTDYAPGRDDLMAYIRTLPRAALRAALPADELSNCANMLRRESARLAGASSATHGLGLMGAYVRQQVALMQEAVRAGLA